MEEQKKEVTNLGKSDDQVQQDRKKNLLLKVLPIAISLPIRAISILVFVVALLVFTGWVLDVSVLTYLIPGKESMAFVSSVAFLFSGGMLFAFSFGLRASGWQYQIVEFFSLILSFLVVLMAFSEIILLPSERGYFGIAVENFASMSVAIPFLFVAMYGMTFLFSLQIFSRLGVLISAGLLLISSSALIGHILEQEHLYFVFAFGEIESAGISFLSTILFMLTGIAQLLLMKRVREYTSL